MDVLKMMTPEERKALYANIFASKEFHDEAFKVAKLACDASNDQAFARHGFKPGGNDTSTVHTLARPLLTVEKSCIVDLINEVKLCADMLENSPETRSHDWAQNKVHLLRRVADKVEKLYKT